MKDAKGHGSNPRGSHAEGVDQIGRSALAGIPLTQEALERLDIDTLDKAAFGYKSGDQVMVGLNDVVPVNDDLENAVYQRQQAVKTDPINGAQNWAQRVLKTAPPVSLEIHQDGKLHVGDGHHRLLAADTLGIKIPGEVEVKAKPIKQILEHGVKQ